MYKCINAYMYTRICIHIDIYVYIYVCVHVCGYVYIHRERERERERERKRESDRGVDVLQTQVHICPCHLRKCVSRVIMLSTTPNMGS